MTAQELPGGASGKYVQVSTSSSTPAHSSASRHPRASTSASTKRLVLTWKRTFGWTFPPASIFVAARTPGARSDESCIQGTSTRYPLEPGRR